MRNMNEIMVIVMAMAMIMMVVVVVVVVVTILEVSKIKGFRLKKFIGQTRNQ
jgi:hypothetical protein